MGSHREGTTESFAPMLKQVSVDARVIAAELWSDGRGYVLLAVAAGWFLSYGVRTMFPALIPFFRSDFQMSLTATGLLLTGLWAAYAVGQFPGGLLGDRIGEGRILVVSTTLSALAVMTVALSVTIELLFLGTILFGIATALFSPTRFTVFTDIYDGREGSAVGLTMAAGSAGNTVLPILATAVAGYATWQYSFGLLFPLFAGVVVFIWFAVPARTSSEPSGDEGLSLELLGRLTTSLARNRIPTLVVVHTLVVFVVQGFMSFYPTYLHLEKGLSTTAATALFATYFAASAVVQPLSGASSDRFGAKASLLAILSVSALALWLVPFADGLTVLFVLTLLVSTLSGTGTITQTYFANELPTDLKGTGLGVIRTVFTLLGATSPLLVGALGDVGLFDEAFLLFGICMTASAIVALLWM